MTSPFATAPAALAALILLYAAPAQAQTSTLGGAAPLSAKQTAEAAGPNQLFPPLPPLASLPPSSGESIDESAPVASGHRYAKKGRRGTPRRIVETTTVRMVVSDQSQAYLTEVEHKLDDALRNPPRDPHVAGNAVSVAQAR